MNKFLIETSTIYDEVDQINYKTPIKINLDLLKSQIFVCWLKQSFPLKIFWRQKSDFIENTTEQHTNGTDEKNKHCQKSSNTTLWTYFFV